MNLGSPVVLDLLGSDRSGARSFQPSACMPKGSKDVPTKREPPPHPPSASAPPPALLHASATRPSHPLHSIPSVHPPSRADHDESTIGWCEVPDCLTPGRTRRAARLGWYGVKTLQAQRLAGP